MWILLAACRDPAHHPHHVPTPAEAFRARGFGVQEGGWRFYDYLDCCDGAGNEDGSCDWNNPSSTYGVVSLPPAPGQTNPGRYDGRWYPLRRDEAVVLVANAPPEARYFDFLSYLALRPGPPSDQMLYAALGPSMNHLDMAAQRGAPIWGRPLAIVSTADREVEARVDAALVASGFDPRDIHHERVPEERVHYGLDGAADLFTSGSRIALFADPAAGEAWLADPGATVFRLTPEAPVEPPAPFGMPTLPAGGTGQGEDGWADAVNALQDAILARWSGRRHEVWRSRGGVVEPFGDCWTSGGCGGDVSDRFLSRFPFPLYLEDDDHLVVVFGVNHARTGKASYSNFSVGGSTVFRTVGGVDSEHMVGTAGFYLPDHPQRDDLFAVTVTRSCAGHAEACFEVPVGCPGVELDERTTLSFRAYLEPATATAPIGSELLLDRTILLWPPDPG